VTHVGVVNTSITLKAGAMVTCVTSISTNSEQNMSAMIGDEAGNISLYYIYNSK